MTEIPDNVQYSFLSQSRNVNFDTNLREFMSAAVCVLEIEFNYCFGFLNLGITLGTILKKCYSKTLQKTKT